MYVLRSGAWAVLRCGVRVDIDINRKLTCDFPLVNNPILCRLPYNDAVQIIAFDGMGVHSNKNVLKNPENVAVSHILLNINSLDYILS